MEEDNEQNGDGAQALNIWAELPVSRCCAGFVAGVEEALNIVWSRWGRSTDSGRFLGRRRDIIEICRTVVHFRPAQSMVQRSLAPCDFVVKKHKYGPRTSNIDLRATAQPIAV